LAHGFPGDLAKVEFTSGCKDLTSFGSEVTTTLTAWFSFTTSGLAFDNLNIAGVFLVQDVLEFGHDLGVFHYTILSQK
jgi:hypothetical protein